MFYLRGTSEQGNSLIKEVVDSFLKEDLEIAIAKHVAFSFVSLYSESKYASLDKSCEGSCEEIHSLIKFIPGKFPLVRGKVLQWAKVWSYPEFLGSMTYARTYKFEAESWYELKVRIEKALPFGRDKIVIFVEKAGGEL